jgi:HSP90 family molecular chaperone
LIKELLERVKEGGEAADTETQEIAKMLTETALINSGYTLNNPADFARR